ncbi:Crp/Fnr family transcriptional regulator [Listeria booriae]|uniref:Crp/Fnr family transcriptional regulator n=1 Tax=Listeria booriae TaxID=1552123 RepID=A0A7X0Z869_9LIST|nr:Crp/Fnr family transcriptional regulator [Listeria booriae]MBC2177755.1 Crp/Fnr family transcriptional regulator [Listeria booriae]MBC2177824.1 Crp/Fnr family transcriptional regulator [Listeria booriae]
MKQSQKRNQSYTETQLKHYLLADPTYDLPYEKVSLDAGAHIVKEPTTSHTLAIITAGIMVEKQGDTVLQLLATDQLIGLGLLCQGNNPSEVTALTHVELVELEVEDVRDKLRERAYGMELLIDVLNSRIRELAERYSFSYTKEEKIWMVLQQLALANGERSASGGDILPPFPKKMMASYLHITTRQVSAVYKKWREEGYMSESEKEIIHQSA